MTMTVEKAEDELEVVKDLRLQGKTLDEIGDEFGVSRQAIQQKWGQELKAIPTSIQFRNNELAALGKEISEYLHDQGPVTRATVVEKFNIDPTDWPKLDIPRYLVNAPSKTNRISFSNTQIEKQLRRANRATEGSFLTSVQYVDWYEKQPSGSVMSLPGLNIRYGSWNASCVAAGVKHGNANRTYTRRWTDAEVLAIVSEYVEKCVVEQVRPTYSGYDAFSRESDSRPSGSSVRIILNVGWPQAVAMSAGY